MIRGGGLLKQSWPFSFAAFLLLKPSVQSVRCKEMRSPLSAIPRCGSSCRNRRSTSVQTDGYSTALRICELHAFVNADRQKNVQRFYWVQFEGYLPTKSELKHKYDSPQHSKIRGIDFYVDTWVRANEAEIQAGSDREHIEALIRVKGYKLPAGMTCVRLVHLLDEQKRKELMIICGEDVASTGVPAAELHEGGKAYDQWPIVEKGLVERAEKKIVLEERGKP
jgi:hypothetical protein